MLQNLSITDCCLACIQESNSVTSLFVGPPTKLCDAWVYAEAAAPGQHGVSACWLITGCTGYGKSQHRSMGLVSPPPQPPPPPLPPAPPAEYNATIFAEAITEHVYRLSIRFGLDERQPLSSPMIYSPNSNDDPATRRVTWAGMEGVASPSGALLVGADQSWKLLDAQNRTVLSSNGGDTSLSFDERRGHSVVELTVNGTAGAPQDGYWPLDDHNSP